MRIQECSFVWCFLLSFALTNGLKQHQHKPFATYNYTSFPDDFKFGVGSSAYQNEGGWNTNGKGINIWDYATHSQPYQILDRSNADISCDAYNKLYEDIELIAKLKVHCYRFSVSWTRLFPLGYATTLNPDGVRYYNELINLLISKNITPMITMYHWDLPQTLQDLGGWANPVLVDIFVHYADKLFALFGDRVKVWTTFNEPSHVCKNAYNGLAAPYLSEDGIGTYLCGHTLLRAHGKTYRMYQKKYKRIQQGSIGIASETDWYEPKNATSAKDKLAIENYMEMNFGWFVHPIYSKTGDYSPVMRRRINHVSRLQNFTHSRLPYFTKKEIREIRGSYDYLGLNHYTTFLLTSAKLDAPTKPSYASDANVLLSQDPSWELTGWDQFVIKPEAIRLLLNYIGHRYGHDIPIAITENGYAGAAMESMNDLQRIKYMNGYIKQVLMAMNDGCNVTSYTYWTLMDNFEWSRGYTLKFGLYNVDFTSDNRTRIPKKSAMVYQSIAVTKKVNETFDPINFVY